MSAHAFRMHTSVVSLANATTAALNVDLESLSDGQSHCLRTSTRAIEASV